MKKCVRKRFNHSVYAVTHFLTLTVSAESRLQTTVRQLGLESSIRHTQGWLKLIIFVNILVSLHVYKNKKDMFIATLQVFPQCECFHSVSVV